MQKFKMITVFAGLVLVLGGLFWLSQSSKDKPLNEEEAQALGFLRLPEPRLISDFDMLDQFGNPFDQSALKEKWSYAFFGYTNCPDVCPITLGALGRAEERILESLPKKLSDQFQGLFVSVDPQRDTVEEVRGYVEHFSENLIGLTGDPDAITQLAEEVGVWYQRINSASELQYLMEHQDYLVIINPEGNCMGYIKPPFDTVQLTRVFKELTREDSS